MGVRNRNGKKRKRLKEKPQEEAVYKKERKEQTELENLVHNVSQYRKK